MSATTAAGALGAVARRGGRWAGGGRAVTGGRVVEFVLVGRFLVGSVLSHVDLDLDLEVHFQVFELGGVDGALGQIDITGIHISV